MNLVVIPSFIHFSLSDLKVKSDTFLDVILPLWVFIISSMSPSSKLLKLLLVIKVLCLYVIFALSLIFFIKELCKVRFNLF